MAVLALGIISDQKLVRRALHSLLQEFFPDLSLAVEADGITDACELIIARKPDILLIDCDHSGFSFEGVRKIRTLSPETKCLLLAGSVEDKFAIHAARSGAWGVISKNTDPAVIHQAIDTLLDGLMWFSQSVMTRALHNRGEERPPEGSPLERLTARETEILILLNKGYHNREIAQRLFLSENTVKTYVKTIYRKLDVSSRVQLVTLNASGAHNSLSIPGPD